MSTPRSPEVIESKDRTQEEHLPEQIADSLKEALKDWQVPPTLMEHMPSSAEQLWKRVAMGDATALPVLMEMIEKNCPEDCYLHYLAIHCRKVQRNESYDSLRKTWGTPGVSTKARGFFSQASNLPLSPHLERLPLIGIIDIGHLHHYHNHADRLAFLPLMQSVEITNEGQWTVDDTRALLAYPHLSQWTTLNLGNTGMDDEAIKALVHSPYLVNLKSLDLHHNRITDEGMRAIAHSPLAKQLNVIKLGSNFSITAEGIAAFADPASTLNPDCLMDLEMESYGWEWHGGFWKRPRVQA